jgi:hypothetical protein
MRYRYTFDVRSHTHLAGIIYFTDGDLKFRLEDTGGRFTKLIVETGNVTIPLETLRTPKQGEEPGFTVPLDPFLDNVIEQIRIIRGALALWGVIDIDVEQFLREFVPDTIQENVAMQVKSISYKRFDREKLPIVPDTTNLLIRCALSREKLAPHDVPLEFYRRGSDDSFHQQYVEAIFNFFFVIEYLFGEGQFRTADLVKNFLASSKFMAGLAEARDFFLASVQSAEVVKRFRKKYVDPADDKVVQTIVELRGQLHHQSIKRMNWHPALQNQFETDAHFLGAICQSVLMAIVLKVLYDEHEKKQFLATSIFDANGNRIIPANPEQLDA